MKPQGGYRHVDHRDKFSGFSRRRTKYRAERAAILRQPKKADRRQAKREIDTELEQQ